MIDPAITNLFSQWTHYLALGIEAVAALIIGVAAAQGTVRVVWLFLHPSLPPEAKEVLRLRLGRWLSVALEFALAADIVRTAVAPTWQEIGQLAAIIAIRTVLNFFLERDISKARAETEKGHTPA